MHEYDCAPTTRKGSRPWKWLLWEAINQDSTSTDPRAQPAVIVIIRVRESGMLVRSATIILPNEEMDRLAADWLDYRRRCGS